MILDRHSVLLVLMSAAPFLAADDTTPDPVMGDWTGDAGPVVQVIALGGGTYRAQVMPAFAVTDGPLAVLKGTVTDGTGRFTGLPAGEVETGKDIKPEENSWWPAPAGSDGWSMVFAAGVLTVKKPDGTSLIMHPHHRQSPTIDTPPPAGAVVLLGPSTTMADLPWKPFKGDGAFPWSLESGGVLRCVPKHGDIISKQTFGSCHLHAEFQLAFEPLARGQNRSNSGLFVQERFELQVLDSYGMKGMFNETGALYRFKAPLVNACLPPGVWQTYDIDFTAANVVDGVMKSPARFTVKLNGVVVQNQTETPQCTGARSKRPITAEPGPILLQDHQHAVAYRNIWITPTR